MLAECLSILIIHMSVNTYYSKPILDNTYILHFLLVKFLNHEVSGIYNRVYDSTRCNVTTKHLTEKENKTLTFESTESLMFQTRVK